MGIHTRRFGLEPQAGKLTGEGESGQAHFGRSVAVSGDATEALIGGLTDAEGQGAVWPFGRSGGSFVQQAAKLTGGSDELHFGYSVALSGDGTLGAVGSPRAETTGLVTVLRRSGSSWQADEERLAGREGAGTGRSFQGAAVAISKDGGVLGVGGPHDNNQVGAAWVFLPGLTPLPPAVANVVPGSGEAGITVTVKGENFTGAEQVFFGSTPATFEKKSALTIEAVAPPGLTGTVDVTVKTPSGVSPVNRPGDEFHYTSKGKDPLPGDGGDGSGTGTQTTSGAGGTKIASGGVLGTTSSGGACLLSLRSKNLAVTGSRTVALRLQRTGAGACSGKLTLSFNKAKRGKRPKLADDRDGVVRDGLGEQQSAEDQPEQGGPQAVREPSAQAQREPVGRALGAGAEAGAQRERAPYVEENEQGQARALTLMRG